MISLEEFMDQHPDYVGWGKMKYRTYAPRLLPYLIWCAFNRKLMTYGELARNVRFPMNYRHGNALGTPAGWLAGYMGNYCIANELPPLNALVVNQRDLIPSIGATPYFKRYGIRNYDRLEPEDQQEALINKIYPLIFQPGIWIELLKVNDIEAIKPRRVTSYDNDNQVEFGKITFPITNRMTQAAESDAHKALKEYVVNNCDSIENLRLLGCTKDNAEMEHVLPSMDRPDVFFGTKDFGVACEIKSWRSDRDDLLRGIFQCVKYKALLNSIDILEERPAASECILVVQDDLDEELQHIANRLRVPHVRVSRRQAGN